MHIKKIHKDKFNIFTLEVLLILRVMSVWDWF